MIENKKRLLLHSCCAPCSTSVLEKLARNYNITLYFYNPNIMPAEEYQKRLTEIRKYTALCGAGLIIDDYNHAAFLEAVRGSEHEPEGGKRCEKCIKMRLCKSAKIAKQGDYDLFTTTLSVSPHKNTELINRLLREEGEKSDIMPLCEDFKKNDGYKRSVELSKKYGLYRQKYCGCVF